MFAHLVKLIWNKKKAHALLITEILASFLVLFGLCTLLIHNIGNYRQPLGFAYDNVWVLSLNNNQDTLATADKLRAALRQLRNYPEVESVSRMGDNVPFSPYHNFNGIANGKIETQVSFYVADENLSQTLKMPVIAGSWYRNADSVNKYRPAVINRQAQLALFGTENPVGKVIGYRGENSKAVWKITGVVDTFKGRGEFMDDEPALVQLTKDNETWAKSLLIRVKPSTDAVFEARMVRDLTSMLKGWSLDVTDLTDLRTRYQDRTLIPVTIFLIVCAFLLINVALGLFGVLNLSIARRRGEIGLRRALGATGTGISRQFVGEIWVLATFGLLIGLLFALQFPLLNVFDLPAEVYLTAIGSAVVMVYAIVTLCALFPSRQAAQIQPAVALHEE